VGNAIKKWFSENPCTWESRQSGPQEQGHFLNRPDFPKMSRLLRFNPSSRVSLEKIRLSYKPAWCWGHSGLPERLLPGCRSVCD